MPLKKPSEIRDQYLNHVKGLKPEVDTKRSDSDWYIRGSVLGGVLSGVYADQKRIADDAFPQSARRDALERHLDLHLDRGFIQPTNASGNVVVTGSTGSSVSAGTTFEYDPNGNQYIATSGVSLGSATAALVPIRSVNTGQVQNLLTGAELSLSSPPAGIDSTATASGNIADGRDVETSEQAAAAILRQVQTPQAGGKVADYETFAENADDSVTSVSVVRFAFGFGTVAVVITSGTTDIDTAIDNGDAIVRIPSSSLIETVQSYVESQAPITDCPSVIAPASVPLDVSVNVRFSSGDKDTVKSGFSVSQGELVSREVKRAIYKTPVGGRKIGASGYVLASEIEEQIDLNLSASPFAEGAKATIVRDRQVQDLSATGTNRSIAKTEIAVPGTITINEL
jgi:uncharacterized phage protein gp47/JayE